MSGKFTVDSNFNVFDEWGRFAGTASQGGSEGAILTIILIILGVSIFLIYLLVRLTVEGIKALIRRDWVRGIFYLLPITAILVYACVVQIDNSISAAQTEALIKRKAAAATKNVALVKFADLICGRTEYYIENNGDYPIWFYSSYNLANPCDTHQDEKMFTWYVLLAKTKYPLYSSHFPVETLIGDNGNQISCVVVVDAAYPKYPDYPYSNMDICLNPGQ